MSGLPLGNPALYPVAGTSKYLLSNNAIDKEKKSKKKKLRKTASGKLTRTRSEVFETSLESDSPQLSKSKNSRNSASSEDNLLIEIYSLRNVLCSVNFSKNSTIII